MGLLSKVPSSALIRLIHARRHLQQVQEATPPGLTPAGYVRGQAAKRGWQTRRRQAWSELFKSRQIDKRVNSAIISRRYKKLHSDLAKKINGLARSVANGDLTARQFELAMQRTLKPAYEEAARLGKAKAKNLHPDDVILSKRDLAAVNRERYDEHKYLKGFSDDINGKYRELDAEQLQAKLEWRANMYADALAGEYDDSMRAHMPDEMEARWVLGPAEHCGDCVQYASVGWQPVSKWKSSPRDGSTKCLSNCNCHFEYRQPGQKLAAKGVELNRANGRQ